MEKNKSTQKKKTIDIHSHIIFLNKKDVKEKYRALMPYLAPDQNGRHVLKARKNTYFSVPDQIYDINLKQRMEAMDKSGVDIQVLSIRPSFVYYDLDSELAAGYSRIQNDAVAKIVNDYPGRFVGLATVPLQDSKESVKELSRAMNDLGLKGVAITTDINGQNLDWPALWPFYEKAQELGAFIFCHPAYIPGAERMKKYHLANLVGNPFATSLAIASMIFGGVLKDFSKLKLCFAHAGGFVPYQIGRFDRGFHVRSECKQHISQPPVEYFSQMHFDTITHSIPSLEFLIKTAGVGKVLMGTDYPYDMNDPEPVLTVNRLETLSRADKEKILCENASALLSI